MGIEVLPCCVDCNTAMVPLKNDIVVLETMNEVDPYKLWCADLVACPICGHRILTGFGATAIKEHYQTDFQEVLDKYKEAGILFTISGKRLAMTTWDRRTN